MLKKRVLANSFELISPILPLLDISSPCTFSFFSSPLSFIPFRHLSHVVEVQQCFFILVSERFFPISPNTLSVSVSEMLSPFAEPVSRLLEFPERRKSFVSIRERVVRAGLPPCLPATPPTRTLFHYAFSFFILFIPPTQLLSLSLAGRVLWS